MRHVLQAVILASIALALAGCASVTTRSYALGDRPETTEKIISTIVTSRDITLYAPASEEHLGYTVVPKEGMIVVRTTEKGHEQIEKALELMRTSVSAQRPASSPATKIVP